MQLIEAAIKKSIISQGVVALSVTARVEAVIDSCSYLNDDFVILDTSLLGGYKRAVSEVARRVIRLERTRSSKHCFNLCVDHILRWRSVDLRVDRLDISARKLNRNGLSLGGL
jgi:hypothetical protein